MIRRILEKIFQILIDILLVLVVVILFVTIYSYVVLNVMGNDYVNFFGYTFFEVASGSMGDAIHKSDVVVVDLNASYDVGDIITYYSDGDFVTHRIVSVGNDKIITRGDANNSNDTPINDSVVLGKVVYILEKVGIWKKIFLEPKVFISMIITLFLFNFTFSYNRKSRKKVKVKKNDKVIEKNDDVIDPEIPYVSEEDE